MPKNTKSDQTIDLIASTELNEVQDLENKIVDAQSVASEAEDGLTRAKVEYKRSLGQGAEAALRADQERREAEVRRDVAEHAVERLQADLVALRERNRVAEVQRLATEAEGRSARFRELAESHLATMATSARELVRAWAEAELAIEAARAAGVSDADLPGAEKFRDVVRVERREISRERVTRWCGFNNRKEPLLDELNAQVVMREGKAYLLGGYSPLERAEFDVITYEPARGSAYATALVESLSVPSLIASGVPGWEPSQHMDPRAALAKLSELEREATAAGQAPRREVELCHVRAVNRTAPAVPA